MKNIVALKNNLIALTDKVFPGVNEMFDSPEKTNGHQNGLILSALSGIVIAFVG